MSRRLLVIGMGAGSPAHLTLEAVEAISRADVFFVFDKGEAAGELVALREHMLETHRRAPWRIARIDSPRRRAAPQIHPAPVGGAYKQDVTAWHLARAALLAETIAAELPKGGVGAMLVWGDPALYDSTLRVLEDVRARLSLDIEVIPGISAVQVLCAAHGLVLNAVGEKVVITTGRRVLEDYPRGGESLVVMLDDGTGLAALIAREAELRATGAPPLALWWGAYLGMKEQMLASGLLAEIGPEILARRAEARARRGWIMDVWLVRHGGSRAD